ncbi:hypothetical protein [Sphingomonas sp.]|jgi:hypothetical protein|uniref:hypothetical protein n=1 Tax=Sphingomonas sp. TaxID=28214 RepID=UPI0017A54B99|nr:hypothetical protein [Sphingomonas sp.]MBA3511589.1 hypothetical protein [Sphingomonas sp.]
MACKAAFGGALITNNFRGLIAEAIVRSVLPPEWRWCSADYAAWDFERSDGVRLEVKQSASKQTWARSNGKPSACSFDIRSRVGRYEGADWFAEPGRSAHLYVFAHHPVIDETADHCDPSQWRFFVVPTEMLPGGKRIGLRSLANLASACPIDELAKAIEHVAAQLHAVGSPQGRSSS